MRTRTPPYTPRESYSDVRPITGVGTRVGISTCQTCGGALLVDTDDEADVFELHDRWHASLEAMHGWAEGQGSHPKQQVTVRRQP